jgi:hypothetical protein
MCVGADSIDDLNVLRAGGMPILFDGVYAPTTLGTLLGEFSFGHARQPESVLREHLIALAQQTPILSGIIEQAFISILIHRCDRSTDTNYVNDHTDTPNHRCRNATSSNWSLATAALRTATPILGIRRGKVRSARRR